MTLATTLAAVPQDSDASSGGSADLSTTIGDFLSSGGELMWPIGLCSVVVLALTIERYLALRKGAMLPRTIGQAADLIGQRRFDEARQVLAKPRAPGENVLASGLRRAGYPLRDVEAAMVDQAHKELEKMRRNVRPLSMIATIAPLLGLLGTVLGIAEAFRRVSQAGLGDPTALADGIQVALNTTIAGLFVAIPAVVLHSLLSGRVRKRLLEVDERLAPLVEPLAGRPRSLEPEPERQTIDEASDAA